MQYNMNHNSSLLDTDSPPFAAKFLSFFGLRSVLQRFPGIFTTLFLLLCFLGPAMAPTVYAVWFAWIHIYFIWSTFRSMLGSWHSYRSVVKHSARNWMSELHAEAAIATMTGKKDFLSFTDILHIIIIPQYKEELETMFETLEVLASHSLAMTYKICLAMEESEHDGPEKARKMVEKFSTCFKRITWTLHPSGLPNEIRGKSSNTGWAVRQMVSEFGTDCKQENVVFTVMDADTCFASDYFEAISYHYSQASVQDRGLMFFSAPTLFDRNADQVPFLVRVYDMQWSMGVMSNYYPYSKKQAPCSAYSLSATLATAVGLWDADKGSIGEDCHMYLKCFFSSRGSMITVPIFSAASQSNIQTMNRDSKAEKGVYFNSKAMKGYLSNLKARYIQSKRHMFAVLDVGYVIRRFFFGLFAYNYDSTKRNQLEKIKIINLNNGFSYFISSISMIYTVFESHFFVVQTLIIIATSSVLLPPGIFPSISAAYMGLFNISLSPQSGTANQLDKTVDYLNGMSNYFRTIGTVFYFISVIYYEKYQYFSGIERWILYRNKLGKRSKLQFSRNFFNYIEWLSFPISSVLYLVLPQLHCQYLEIFTDSLDYVVSVKPTGQARSNIHNISIIESDSDDSVRNCVDDNNRNSETPLVITVVSNPQDSPGNSHDVRKSFSSSTIIQN